jgi:hypothetical protein
MNQVLSQFRRIFADNGRGDKDFGKQEAQLREAQRNLHDAISSMTRASEILKGLINSKDEKLH